MKHSGNAVHLRALKDDARSFFDLFRHAVVQRFEHISSVQNATIHEEIDWDKLFYAPNMAIILVAGKDLRLTIKCHFFLASGKSSLFQSRSKSQIFDFYKEFCNLTAGALKQSLLDQNVICGISLPTVLSGYDELIFSDRRRPGRLYDCFSLRAEDFASVMTIAVDAGSEEVLDGLRSIDPKIKDNEEIEFL